MPGPDGLHPKLLSAVKVKPLCAIYSQSMETEILPEDWKIGDILPIL